jgi:hypothetical protein
MTERKDEYNSQKWELQKPYAGYTGFHNEHLHTESHGRNL